MLLVARSNLPPSDPALALLPRCKTLRDVEQLHARLITSGFLRYPSLAAGVVIRLSSSPHPASHHLARRVFFSLPIPTDPFLWNALIKSSSHGRDPNQAVLIFALMLAAGITADEFSYSLALKGCSRASLLREGSQMHSLIRKTELSSNLYLQNSLIGFYARCGLYELARQVFDRIPQRDSVSWNSMIDGYVKNGRIGAARELFDQMRDGDRNLVTWNSMIGGCASETNGIGIDMARRLFDEMPERDLVSWNLMIDGYARCGRMVDAEDLFERMLDRDVISWANMIYGYMEAGSVALARKLFDEMPERDVINWNIMMSGYVKNGNSAEALNLFSMMRLQGSVAPDNATLASVLSAISELGRIHDGIAIHEYIERNCLPLDGKLGVSLIDMYSKCGRLEDALEVFEISGRSVDHWNAMICGLAVHGCGALALELFREMERCLVVPDDITFIGVLNACSHSGLVEEGLMCFEMMKRDYNLEPKVQHYGCMVDVLGRAGQLDEAMELVKNMPVEPNDVVWRSLLSACRSHRNFDMGQTVVKNIIEGGTCNSSSYVLLSNLYASIGMWGDVGKVRMIMREKDLRKVPGCSWIELDGVVHEFVVGDNSYSEAKGIYSLLEGLCKSKLCNSPVL
ncbi:pentatricopeptide repeat-containing protein At2g45350, chloroplastic [Phoenix dactylifera]|uniref:Pentatricopeptide repeat-containing protein At2g45350, chloroplastic n=1 Tax=Phoenix dactylifera TaxID=42345 RepID=A0A8B7C470_PHODC|nr:pentatricopeptide repeat-containing protein At2g45350, chloroplastic [Phoenix dactylifera]